MRKFEEIKSEKEKLEILLLRAGEDNGQILIVSDLKIKIKKLESERETSKEEIE